MLQRNVLLERVGVLYLQKLRYLIMHHHYQLFATYIPQVFLCTPYLLLQICSLVIEKISFFAWQIQEALQRATFDSSSQVGIIFHVMDAVESPPTYFRTNRFTSAYQEIVDAYGWVLAYDDVLLLLTAGMLTVDTLDENV